MMKDKKMNAQKMLKIYDENIDMFSIFEKKPKDVSKLVESMSLLLKQMKTTKETSIKIKENFKGSDEEFTKIALKEVNLKIRPIVKKLDKLNPIELNSIILGLPDKKGRVIFEIMADTESVKELPLNDTLRRKTIDKNIERMEDFVKYLRGFQEELDEERRKVIKEPSKNPKMLQLKIYLKGSRPQIWRRILVEDNITFHKLHLIIQEVMGWENYHLYAFEKGDLRIESKELSEDEYFDFEPSEKILLNQVLNEEKSMINYTYDFGDTWNHSISAEKILDKDESRKYPVCIDGKMNCPPEDSGGLYGYYEMLEIKKDKKHPRYEELIVGWLGENFDSEEFDIKEINKRLQNDRL